MISDLFIHDSDSSSESDELNQSDTYLEWKLNSRN